MGFGFDGMCVWGGGVTRCNAIQLGVSLFKSFSRLLLSSYDVVSVVIAKIVYAECSQV